MLFLFEKNKNKGLMGCRRFEKKICGKTKAVALEGAAENRTVGVGSKGISMVVLVVIRLLWTNVGLLLWQRGSVVFVSDGVSDGSK